MPSSGDAMRPLAVIDALDAALVAALDGDALVGTLVYLEYAIDVLRSALGRVGRPARVRRQGEITNENDKTRCEAGHMRVV